MFPSSPLLGLPISFISSFYSHPALKHRPYLHVLPHPSKLRTPLHFTEQELEALKGSNLYGATLDRVREWQTEWNQCRDAIRLVNEGWALDFSWCVTLVFGFRRLYTDHSHREHWKTVATYISSRAFPSTLLSPHPSLVATKSSHPILLPGVDSLNHARAHPVSWVVHVPSEPDSVPEASTISLVHHQPISAHSVEIFNNYGPKGNPELLLGYGFVMPDNPDDTIVLRVGGGGSGGTEGKRWEVGREAEGIEGLWQEVLDIVSPPSPAEDASDSDDDGETHPPQWSLHLDAAAALQSMVEPSLDRLPATFMEDVVLRPDVREMIQIYVKGQREILEGIARFAQEKEEAALNSAAEQGVEVVMED